MRDSTWSLSFQFILPFLLVLSPLFIGEILWSRKKAKRERKRKMELAALAERWGFQFSEKNTFSDLLIKRDDPIAILRTEFQRQTDEPSHLFPSLRRPGSCAIKDVMWGNDPEGISIRIFQFVLRKGNWSAFYDQNNAITETIAIADVGWDLPLCSISHDDLGPGFRGIPPTDIQFEDELFNRTMSVRSRDARFATALIGTQMMDWLMRNEFQFQSIEVGANWLVIRRHFTSPSQYNMIPQLMHDFIAHVPQVVFEWYPKPVSK